MSKVGYSKRDGQPCTKAEWSDLRKDLSYCSVRQFDNDIVRVEVKWHGLVRDPQNLFRETYPLFMLNVYNYNSFGDRVVDPVESGKTFPTEEAAVAFYEKFVERWSESYVDDGVLVEVGNSLAPPPPPNLDAPSSEVASIKGIEDDGCGAW